MKFIDLLPETKSEKHGGLTWEPADVPGTGVLTIQGKKMGYTRYKVAEFPTAWAGRAFTLVKIDAGSDKAAENYCCFISTTGQEKRCDCKGFAYSGGCKHLASLQTLIEQGQL